MVGTDGGSAHAMTSPRTSNARIAGKSLGGLGQHARPDHTLRQQTAGMRRRSSPIPIHLDYFGLGSSAASCPARLKEQDANHRM